MDPPVGDAPLSKVAKLCARSPLALSILGAVGRLESGDQRWGHHAKITRIMGVLDDFWLSLGGILVLNREGIHRLYTFVL